MGRINSGQLTQRVTLLTPAVALSDGRGGYVPQGPELANTVWARVRPLRTVEKLALGQELNSEAYEITVRQTPGTSRTARQRVLWNDKSLSVQGVTPDEHHEYLLLTCFESGK